MVNPLKIGTRGSDLALAQTAIVCKALHTALPNQEVTTHTISTRGDAQLDIPLQVFSKLEQGLFTKELEEALFAGQIDAAIHSLKDLPVVAPSGLALAAILPRADVRDVLLSKHPGGLEGLPQGAHVGTGSPRRSAQLLRMRPDLVVEGIRGNVPTRIERLTRSPHLDALILAGAGLERLGLGASQELQKKWGLHPQTLEEFLPAPGQGAIAVQIRAADLLTRSLLLPIHDPPTALCVQAERLLLNRLGGGCLMALGAYAQQIAEGIWLRAIWFQKGVCRTAEALSPSPEEAAQSVCEQLQSLFS